ncbi:MAG: hypothetical protein IOC82_16335 [Aestuariivirga sp.]|uniref:hypothetical protein n=1 Tax=Aestuariivirga sp. TaxID=2650926 RepID=UPI0025BBBBBB|nr:hypothetical protein [Aestuariivirga sp.]MCA3562586.1 hypothetical protein [Aestuariivirga sp.]
MSVSIDDLLPSAKSLAEKIALSQAEEAQRLLNQQKEAEAERQAFIEQLSKPSGVSDEEGIRRALRMIQRATDKGMTSVQVYRFPNVLCTDRGRAINQGEKGWETTLTGVPLEIYQLWNKYFRAKGYKLMAEIVDFPDGVPGDVALSLSWV